MAKTSSLRWERLLGALLLLSLAAIDGNLGALAQDPEVSDHEAKIEEFRKQLRSKDPKERAKAANQLGLLGATQAAAELQGLLHDASPQVQFSALHALLDLDVKEVLPDALRLLEARAPNVQIMAAQTVLAFGDKQSTEKVLRLLESSGPYLQHNLALLAGIYGLTEAAPTLEKLLSSPDRMVRYWALSALGTMGRKESGPVVAKYVDDPDRDMQRASIHALGRIDPAEYRKELRKALASGSMELQRLALSGLARIQDPEALKVALETGNQEFLNFYQAPKACSLLESTRIPRQAIRREPVRSIIKVVSERTGLKIEVSERAPEKMLSARYGPNFGMLGSAPSAIQVLGSFNVWFVNVQPGLSFLAEEDRIRIVPPEEAKEHWESWAKQRAAK